MDAIAEIVAQIENTTNILVGLNDKLKNMISELKDKRVKKVKSKMLKTESRDIIEDV